jgi:hypothetical protein
MAPDRRRPRPSGPRGPAAPTPEDEAPSVRRYRSPERRSFVPRWNPVPLDPASPAAEPGGPAGGEPPRPEPCPPEKKGGADGGSEAA